jgi:predicted CXXCH cytochrome family protein
MNPRLDRSALKLGTTVVRHLKVAALVSAGFILSTLFCFGASGGPDPTPEAFLVAAQVDERQAGQSQRKLDPAAWGGSHVGKPVPEFVHGDECLFCHRNDIGPGWQKNAHGITLRQQEDAPNLLQVLKTQPALSTISAQVEFFLGSRHRVRFLKKEGYGKLALLNTQVVLGSDGHAQKWTDSDKPVWDKQRFADRCAGCHATAVDPATKSFSAFGLDCYTCHGVVDLDHTKDTSLIFLSKKRRSDARTITSTCAQCHLRIGHSKSTGLPYPNNFVAGDNLLQDYEVDFSRAEDESLNAGDRHVLRNVRDIVLNGSEFPTCLSCHDLHKQSSFKHRRAPRTAVCTDCHNAEGPLKIVKPYTVTSSLCEY